MGVIAEILLPGPAVEAECLALTAPISFWGGVDPRSGEIIDARHPQRGRNVAGMVLALPGTIGSSSASAVLLELVHAGKAPAAILIAEPDAILLLGLVVAREMGWPTPMAAKLPAAAQAALAGKRVSIAQSGAISAEGE
jgi:predicted aconitase with swiveling domain